MTHDFDPMYFRRRYEAGFLKSMETESVVDVLPSARVHYSKFVVGDLVQAYLAGMAGVVRGLLERQLNGMLSVSEPQRAEFHQSWRGEEMWCEQLYEWRQLLGLCKWLAGESAEREFAASVAADWQGLQSVPEDETLESRKARCEGSTLRLATALAGKAPRIGLDMLEICKPLRVSRPMMPLVGFGEWACHHLMTRGHQDEAFLLKGTQALKATLLPVLLRNFREIETGLWLKVIFFDSGAAKTAEEAMILAYDCMPGVKRPDFGAGSVAH